MGERERFYGAIFWGSIPVGGGGYRTQRYDRVGSDRSYLWAEPGSGFTAQMEGLVFTWLNETSINADSRLMELTWDQIDGIMQRGR